MIAGEVEVFEWWEKSFWMAGMGFESGKLIV
jgi:hypothetical protein